MKMSVQKNGCCIMLLQKFVYDTTNKFNFICEPPQHRREPLQLPQKNTKRKQTPFSQLLETQFVVPSTGLERPEHT